MELYTKLLSTIYILKEKVFKFRMHHPYIFELYHTSLRESSFVVDLCYFSPIILEALHCFIYNQQKLKFSIIPRSRLCVQRRGWQNPSRRHIFGVGGVVIFFSIFLLTWGPPMWPLLYTNGKTLIPNSKFDTYYLLTSNNDCKLRKTRVDRTSKETHKLLNAPLKWKFSNTTFDLHFQ